MLVNFIINFILQRLIFSLLRLHTL